MIEVTNLVKRYKDQEVLKKFPVPLKKERLQV